MRDKAWGSFKKKKMFPCKSEKQILLVCCKQNYLMSIKRTIFNVFCSLFFSWERTQLGRWWDAHCYKLSKLRLGRLIKPFHDFFQRTFVTSARVL